MTSASTEPDKRRFAWLRPPQGGADGTMSLIDHLRELRYRVTVAASAIVVGAIVSAFFYNDIVRFVLAPWARARSALTTGLDSDLIIANNGVTQAFTVAVILCLVAGIFFSAPIWLWQVWAFVAPGLLAKEKKYSLAFVAVSLPLFFAGCALGYYVWPKGIEVLLSFTPSNMGITNILDVANFLSLEIKVVLVFGLSFLLPVVVVGLNMAGVVRGYQLKKARKKLAKATNPVVKQNLREEISAIQDELDTLGFHIGSNLLEIASPDPLISQERLERLDAWLLDPPAPKGAVRFVREYRDRMARALRAQESDASVAAE